MDKKLLEILCCPVSKTAVTLLVGTRLTQLNNEIANGQVVYVDGTPVEGAFESALITEDDKVIYGIVDGIPVMLPNRGIGTVQFTDL